MYSSLIVFLFSLSFFCESVWSSESCSILEIPNDILTEIVKYLDIREKLTLVQVTKRFRAQFQDDLVIEALAKKMIVDEGITIPDFDQNLFCNSMNQEAFERKYASYYFSYFLTSSLLFDMFQYFLPGTRCNLLKPECNHDLLQGNRDLFLNRTCCHPSKKYYHSKERIENLNERRAKLKEKFGITIEELNLLPSDYRLVRLQYEFTKVLVKRAGREICFGLVQNFKNIPTILTEGYVKGNKVIFREIDWQQQLPREFIMNTISTRKHAVVDIYNRSLLSIGCVENKKRWVNQVLRYQNDDWWNVDVYGNTPMHLLFNELSMHITVKKRSNIVCSLVKAIKKQGKHVHLLMNKRNNNGETALIRALKNKFFGSIVPLLENGADPNIATIIGYAPLTLGISLGNMEVIEKLLSFGANPDIFNGKEGRVPLMLAMGMVHFELAELLLKYGADIHCIDRVENCSPYEYAMKYNKHDFVKLFLNHYTNQNYLEKKE